MINFVKQFSSSLTCLSIDFTGWEYSNITELPFNGVRLQHELLESMIKLNKFQLYAKFSKDFF